LQDDINLKIEENELTHMNVSFFYSDFRTQKRLVKTNYWFTK